MGRPAAGEVMLVVLLVTGPAKMRSGPVTVSGLANVVAIEARHEFTCAIVADGTARCWGRNTSGQLGDGTTQSRPTPVVVSGLSNTIAISGGEFHACALIADGTVRCWGLNSEGQLGNGTSVQSLTPVPVTGVTNAVAIAAGARHNCALIHDGSVLCWGRNVEGELGNTNNTNQPIATPVALGASNAVAITAGGENTCALIANGSVSCWGANIEGQLGDGTFVSSNLPVAVSGIANVVSLAAGASHNCAVVVSGQAFCWGENVFGQIGDGSTQNRGTPVLVSGLTAALAIDGGTGHTCALRVDGSARCWGGGGLLGNGTNTGSPTPTSVLDVAGSISGKHIAGGGSFTCAVRANSTASCWGSNISGQIGDNSTTNRPIPTPVTNLTGAVAIALGFRHSCVTGSAGVIACWGDNTSGQLGDGTTVSRAIFGVVPNLNNVQAIAAGDNHTCALGADGTARCWGLNSVGQLGDDSSINRTTPVPVTGLTSTNIRAVAMTAGNTHTCALRSNSTVFCWGSNGAGQLGDNTHVNRDVPVPVVGSSGFLLSTVVSIAAGGLHTCALVAGGGVRCWGENGSGQLGDGTTNDRSTAPGSSISGLNNVVAIIAGQSHSCALIASGIIGCWGNNSFGQLGNNSTANSSIPVKVNGVTNAIAIAAGNFHTCALLANGSVQCWGLNNSGQVGDNTTATRTVPVTVPSFTLNINPVVELKSNGRVTTVNILAVCEEGRQLFVDVAITQGAAAGVGSGHGNCTGALENYPVTVPAQGPNRFITGPAQVQADAIIREQGQIVDQQQWSRNVQIVAEP